MPRGILIYIYQIPAHTTARLKIDRDTLWEVHSFLRYIALILALFVLIGVVAAEFPEKGWHWLANVF